MSYNSVTTADDLNETSLFTGFEVLIQNIVRENNIKQSLLTRKRLQTEELRKDSLEKQERIKILQGKINHRREQNYQLQQSASLRQSNIDRLRQHVKLLDEHESSLKRQLTLKKLETSQRKVTLERLTERAESMRDQQQALYTTHPLLSSLKELPSQLYRKLVLSDDDVGGTTQPAVSSQEAEECDGVEMGEQVPEKDLHSFNVEMNIQQEQNESVSVMYESKQEDSTARNNMAKPFSEQDGSCNESVKVIQLATSRESPIWKPAVKLCEDSSGNVRVSTENNDVDMVSQQAPGDERVADESPNDSFPSQRPEQTRPIKSADDTVQTKEDITVDDISHKHTDNPTLVERLTTSCIKVEEKVVVQSDAAVSVEASHVEAMQLPGRRPVLNSPHSEDILQTASGRTAEKLPANQTERVSQDDVQMANSKIFIHEEMETKDTVTDDESVMDTAFSQFTTSPTMTSTSPSTDCFPSFFGQQNKQEVASPTSPNSFSFFNTTDLDNDEEPGRNFGSIFGFNDTEEASHEEDDQPNVLANLFGDPSGNSQPKGSSDESFHPLF